MKISVIGLGWYGEVLARHLKQDGHEVLGTTRNETKISNLQNDGIQAFSLTYPHVPVDELMAADVVVLNIPPFPEELAWFKSWKWNPSSWIIFISSTALYPAPATENALLLAAQEEWIKSSFQKWTILRFGGLIGGGRHPGKFLSGRKNLSGRLWPVNLIHQRDAVGFTQKVLELKLQRQTFHLVSDEHPSKESFYTDFCQEKGLPLPLFDQTDQSQGKIVPNEEMKKYYSSFHQLSID